MDEDDLDRDDIDAMNEEGEDGEEEEDEEGEDIENDDDDDEDDDDDDEDDDLDREKGSKKRRTGKIKRKRNIFLDDIAGVDDDGEDEDGEDEGEDGLVADEPFDEEEAERQYGDRLHREIDARRQREEDIDEEELARRFRDRYGRNRANAYQQSENVASRMLMPSVNDPSLWLVRCRSGYEKTLIMQLWRKYMESTEKNRMNIMSIFTRENMPGYIYVESRDKKSVDLAIENLNGVYAQTVKVIPVEDMVACLHIKRSEKNLTEGAWVRVKKGKYAGDLGKIIEVLDGGASIRVKLLPRLESSADDRTFTGEKRKKSTTSVPPQKLFNPEHVSKSSYVKNNYGGYVYQNEVFDKDGYLEKDIKVTTVQLDNVNPSLEEITRFSGGSVHERNLDLEAIASRASTAADFQVGDHVEIFRGDLKDVTGKVLAFEKELVTIMPSDVALGALRIDAKDLRKRFEEGDHVKVIHGNHAGETGLVVSVVLNVATVLSDSNYKQIQVLTKDLRGKNDTTTLSLQQSIYDIDDVVQISSSDAGVVIKVETGSVSVLDQWGKVSKIPIQQIQRKIDNKNVRTSDFNGNTLAPRDSVTIKDSNRRGTIIHIYRHFVFVKCREIMENGGVFVTKPQNLESVSAAQTGASSINRNFARPLPVSNGMGRGGGRRDPLINATVTIIGGAYKGYLGIVKDMTSGGARVELHTNSRTITVNPDILKVHGSSGVSRPSFDSFSGGNSGDRYGSGSRTPGYGAGSRTPRRSDGGITPNPYGDGSRTPGWDGGRTPGWSGGRTPARDGGGWDSGAKTPARGGAMGGDEYSFGRSALADNAESPFIPNTPHYDQETPFNPDTPGNYGMPQTPGSYPNPATGGLPNTPGNPATPYDATTPYNPTTPFSTGASYQGAGEAGGSAAQVQRPDNWLTTDIEVVIKPTLQKSYKNGTLDYKRGVIRAVETSQLARVIMSTDTHSVESVPIEFLEPVKPERKDRIKVVGGSKRGEVGELIAIDHDGLVRLNNGVFEPIAMAFLARHISGV